MPNPSTYPLRLPQSLKAEVAKIAQRDGTSINQFIAIAVAEKISALETEHFFSQRVPECDREAFRALLFREGGEPPREGDELS